MTIRRIDVVSIPVSDQARSKAFYVDKLAFSVKLWRPFATFDVPDGNGWVLQPAAPEA